MKQLMLLFLSFCFFSVATAQENNDALFNKGLNAFASKDYQTSATIFNELVKKDSLNATLHYNLGTSYLRLQKAGLSIYHLEKSLKLQPDNEAARINLNFAEKLKTKTIKGNLTIPQQQMLYSVFHFLKPNTWAYMAIGFTFLSVVLWLIFGFNNNSSAKKILFGTGIFTLVLSVSCYFISINQSNYLLKSQYVIVSDSQVSLMEEPRTISKIISTIEEGEKALIKEETNQWIKVQLPNDTLGWVEKNKVQTF